MIKVEFILASSSPRRIELLKKAGLKFRIIPADIVENNNSNDPIEVAIKNSYFKALKVAKKFKNNFVAGFDTVVEIDGKIIGKPKNREEAEIMLKTLSGKVHTVTTGFTILNLNKMVEIKKYCVSRVKFKNLLQDEIDWYLSTDEPYDKAGAYAIQGIGAFMVKEIYGSFTNVIGLPLCEFIEVLRELK